MGEDDQCEIQLYIIFENDQFGRQYRQVPMKVQFFDGKYPEDNNPFEIVWYYEVKEIYDICVDIMLDQRTQHLILGEETDGITDNETEISILLTDSSTEEWYFPKEDPFGFAKFLIKIFDFNA